MSAEIRSLFADLLEQQSHWTHQNTPEMIARGLLIRDTIPSKIQSLISSAPNFDNLFLANLRIQGRDGTGRKTEIPWARVYLPSHSPNAREGWYCVLLIHARGEGLFLALTHGSTRWENGEFKPRSKDELRSLVDWAKRVLNEPLSLDEELKLEMNLGATGDLGPAYQNSTVACRWYSKEHLPSDERFSSDLLLFLGLLAKLYEQEDLGRSPEHVANQERLAEAAIAAISRPISSLSRGQGFGLTSEERIAVEQRAMKLAAEYLRSAGYSPKDVSANSSCDFLVSISGIDTVVEVKGSTGPCTSVILTSNEADLHASRFPNNALIVVSSIDLDRKVAPPRASGGKLRVYWPWDIAKLKLRPLSYQCEL